MVKVVLVLPSVLLAVVLATLVVACAPAAPTPTATPKPAVAVATPTKAAPTPTPQLIRWVGEKLQPLPDGFPSKTITLWSAFKAGHVSDVYLRLLAEIAKRYSPVPVVADNRVTGPRFFADLLDFFATQPGATEGYALAYTSYGGAALRSITVDVSPYTHRDVNPVILTEIGNFGIGVRADDARFKSIQDLVKWAKENPGKLKVGSSAVGSQVHLTAVLLGKEAGFDFTYVPHSGATEALLTLMGGGVDVVVSNITDWVVRPELKVLLQTGEKKAAILPDVPLAQELGYKIPLYSDLGLFTHPKVSKERIAWHFELFKKVAESPEYEKRMKDLGVVGVIKGPEEMRQSLDEQVRVLDPLIRELGLHKEQAKEKPKP